MAAGAAGGFLLIDAQQWLSSNAPAFGLFGTVTALVVLVWQSLVAKREFDGVKEIRRRIGERFEPLSRRRLLTVCLLAAFLGASTIATWRFAVLDVGTPMLFRAAAAFAAAALLRLAAMALAWHVIFPREHRGD